MTASLYWIDGPWQGRLAIVPRPRGGDWLEDEVKAWKRAGLRTIVSALTNDEAEQFNLTEESTQTHAQELDFVPIPIPDRGVPASSDAFLKAVGEIEQQLRAGKDVGVHCRQSIGRSALITAGILVQGGVTPAQALQRIERARGLPVPETAEQKTWILQLKKPLSGPIDRQRSVSSTGS
jgi:protein-tyrosine phosphatase